MKKLKYIFISLFALTMALSCDDDGGDSKLNLKTSAVPDIQKVEGSQPIIDLLAIQEGEDVSISFTADIGMGTVSSMDVVGYYFAGDGSVEKVVLANDVTTFPTTITLSKQQLIDTFAVLNSDADFSLGDQLVITGDLTLKDGTVVTMLTDAGGRNYGTDIQNSPLFKVTQTYNVSCPSDLGGTYTALSSGASTDSGPTPDENPISNYPYNITLTDNGGGSYTLSDAFGGLYILWYDIYGLTFEVPGDITDVCGTLSGSFTDPFGANVTIDGVVNGDGTITYTWVNDFGDTGTTTLTKVP